jgi:hypothetical protein
MNFFREISNWLRHRRQRQQENTAVIDDHDLRTDEDAIRIEPHIDFSQTNIGGKFSLSVDVQTANACFICYQQFDERVREFRAHRNSHWCESHYLSGDDESMQELICSLMMYCDEKENQIKLLSNSLRRYCTDCVLKTITFHLSKASSWKVSYHYMHETAVQTLVTFSCPLCFEPCSDFSPVRAALNACCEENRHCRQRVCLNAKTIGNIYNRYQLQMPHWFSCNVSGCNYASQANVKRKSIVCPEHGEMCVICLAPAHSRSILCSVAVEEAFANKKDKKGQLRRCPECLMTIEKDGGCERMVCICGRSFSWHNALLISGERKKRK